MIAFNRYRGDPGTEASDQRVAGELFAELVRAGCKRFVVGDRERGPGEPAAEGDGA
jgi:hypothetical protein